MQPYLDALRAAGLLEWAYVYGGDECPAANQSGQMQAVCATAAAIGCGQSRRGGGASAVALMLTVP